MEINDKIELSREYVKTLQKFKYWIVRAMGFSRFSLKNNRIVEKSLSSVAYGVFVLLTAIVAVIHVIYETAVRRNYLFYTELVIFLELSMIVNLLYLNITFGDRHSMSTLIEHSIEIDTLLGIEQTKFMRDIVDAAYTIMGLPVLVVQITVVTFMYVTFDVSFLVHVTGSAYFLWAFFAFHDVVYLVSHYTYLNLRTKYMNVALMKKMNVKQEYIPDSFLLKFFWKSKHNDLVTYHENADVKKFVKVYKMLFNHLNLFLKCAQFTIFTGFMCITLGSLFCVQAIILYGKSGISMLRKYIIVSWLCLSWLIIFGISLLVDLFSRQIEQTKLICTYAQLRSINNEAIYRFTKSIFRALEIRVARASIYGVFFLDPGMVLRVAASTFVYITAQLQISMPALDGKYNSSNFTMSPKIPKMSK